MKKTLFKLLLLIIFGVSASIYIYYKSEHVDKIHYEKDILTEQADFEDLLVKDMSYSYQNPKVILNPYGNSPLTALVIFETNDLTAPTIIVNGKDKNTTFSNTFVPSKKHVLPVYGLYPNFENKVTLKVNGKVVNLAIKTDKLPDDIIKPTNIQKNDDYLNNDLYFTTSAVNGYTVGYDTNGDIRWYLTEQYADDITFSNNGHLLLSSNRKIENGLSTGLVEMDLNGKIYFEYNIPNGFHNSIYEMENGNLLLISKDKNIDNIVLINRENGSILKTWNLGTLLPLNNDTIISSIWYDKNTNSITVSIKDKSIIVNIDYEENEINWIIGDPNGWDAEYLKYFFTGLNNFEWQYSQNKAILYNNNVLTFDNGMNRSNIPNEFINANENYSRLVLFQINTDNMTIEQKFEFGKERGSKFYSSYSSDIDYLGDSHFLILSGGNIYENGEYQEYSNITSNSNLNSTIIELLNKQVIFEMELPTNNYHIVKSNIYNENSYYLSKPLLLGNLNETETSKHTFFIFNHDIDKNYENKNIKITKEKDRIAISGEFKNDSVTIILRGVFSTKSYHVDGNVKYINDTGLKGKYYIFIKINDTVYDPNLYVFY